MNEKAMQAAGLSGMTPGSQAVVQVAFVVPDIHEAMQAWLSLGVGPFFLAPHMQLEEHRYRGELIEPDFSSALAQAGGVQIEVTQQHDETPSVYNDSVFVQGIHHVAFVPDDYDAAIAEWAGLGFESIVDIQSRDVRTAYLDATDKLGFLIEMCEKKPSLVDMFDRVAAAGRDWDGSDPIRKLGW